MAPRPAPSAPGAPLAVVLLVSDAEAVARCLRALGTEAEPGVALLAGGTPGGRRALEALGGEREVRWLEGDGAAVWNGAARAVPGADLLLLHEATELGPGAIADLRRAAAAVPDAATVTALANDAGFLSVPQRNVPWPLLPPGLTIADAAARVRERSPALHPRIPAALPHCALVRRPALDLVGPFDEALAPAAALLDFSARATATGLAHVAADDVLVAHRGAGAAPPVDGERTPALAAAIEDAAHDRFSALARSLLLASVALERLEVTVDARVLGPGVTGTTVHTLGVLGALAARDDVRVRALLPDRLGDEAGAALDRLGGAVVRIAEADLRDGTLGRSHVAHRPWQVESVQEMALLDRVAERTVVTHQDLIGYRTPSVFGSVQEWRDYRRATVDALGLAAMVLFFSEAAAADAAADDLVAPERSRVVAIGTDAPEVAAPPEPRRPAGLAERERPYLLVLGNRFRHKNVRFALELLAALRDAHGWDGELVIAGAEVLHGSGSADDAAWLMGHADHARHVVELGAVHEAEKAWLLAHAAAVVYPSTYEGFGLVPFEAAAAGTPCLVAPASALRDSVPEELALLVPWDAAASAERCAAVLIDPAARAALVGGLRAAGAALTWAAAGEQLVRAYHDALALPAPAAVRLGADLARAEHDYWTVRDGIPPEAWPLVVPEAPLIDIPLARDLTALLRSAGGRARLLRALRIARRLPGRG
jgi:glycosyltransferase involved in cell wall biosynthesis